MKKIGTGLRDDEGDLPVSCVGNRVPEKHVQTLPNHAVASTLNNPVDILKPIQAISPLAALVRKS